MVKAVGPNRDKTTTRGSPALFAGIFRQDEQGRAVASCGRHPGAADLAMTTYRTCRDCETQCPALRGQRWR